MALKSMCVPLSYTRTLVPLPVKMFVIPNVMVYLRSSRSIDL